MFPCFNYCLSRYTQEVKSESKKGFDSISSVSQTPEFLLAISTKIMLTLRESLTILNNAIGSVVQICCHQRIGSHPHFARASGGCNLSRTLVHLSQKKRPAHPWQTSNSKLSHYSHLAFCFPFLFPISDVHQPLSQIRMSLAGSLGTKQIIFLSGIGATENMVRGL